MNDKWLTHYKGKGMTENQTFNAFFKPSEYDVLTEEEKNELNKYIDEERAKDDRQDRT